MFQSWRWKIKQAEAACAAGRIDEAMRTLRQDELRLFQPAERVVDRLAAAYRARIETRISASNFAGAWADLECMEELKGPTEELRGRLVDAELAQALRRVEAGDAAGTVAIIDGLERRQACSDRGRRIRDAARRAEAGARVTLGGRAKPSASQRMPVMVDPQGKSRATPRIPSRFRLWIDAVGGYLVCLADQVVLGQAIPGNKVDIPILGDLSRRHAIIRRQGEGYFIEPNHAVSVERQPIQEATLLTDGDEIALGPSVRIRFRKPHVLSATARLEFVSRHSTAPSADGILLMAESCVLGPRWQNHVVCRNWADDVILYRQDEQLYCRAMDSIQIDGEWMEGRGRVGDNSHIAGADFALSLEVI
ncbi:MAG: FHA domain-containing protein [Planctomycetes bacterium]|nr:FHA domain-containing protein [Planctomycetota bacterium]